MALIVQSEHLHVLEAGRWRDRLAICEHALGVESEYLPCVLHRFIDGARGGDGAGEVREGDAISDGAGGVD